MATTLVIAGIVLLQPPPAPSAEPTSEGRATVAADPFGFVAPAPAPLPAPAAAAPDPDPPAIVPDETATTEEPGRWPDGRARRHSPHTAPNVADPSANDPSDEGWSVAAGTGAIHGTGRLLRFTVEVEPATGVDPVAAARAVESTLADPRGWLSTGRFAFQRTDDPATADIRVVVATPTTVDAWCASVGLHTAGWLSCQVHRRAMLNHDRWEEGVPSFAGDVELYRAYLVNHEVGHVLGYGHVGCSGRGRLAPVMMQQSKSLDGCRPNGWIAPDASD